MTITSPFLQCIIPCDYSIMIPLIIDYFLVVHAEPNAIMHKTCIDLKDCSLYTTFFPCNECAKIIIQAGIKKIYYLMDDKPDKLYMKCSRELLLMAGYQVDDQRRSRDLASHKLMFYSMRA